MEAALPIHTKIHIKNVWWQFYGEVFSRVKTIKIVIVVEQSAQKAETGASQI